MDWIFIFSSISFDVYPVFFFDSFVMCFVIYEVARCMTVLALISSHYSKVIFLLKRVPDKKNERFLSKQKVPQRNSAGSYGATNEVNERHSWTHVTPLGYPSHWSGDFWRTFMWVVSHLLSSAATWEKLGIQTHTKGKCEKTGASGFTVNLLCEREGTKQKKCQRKGTFPLFLTQVCIWYLFFNTTHWFSVFFLQLVH